MSICYILGCLHERLASYKFKQAVQELSCCAIMQRKRLGTERPKGYIEAKGGIHLKCCMHGTKFTCATNSPPPPNTHLLLLNLL